MADVYLLYKYATAEKNWSTSFGIGSRMVVDELCWKLVKKLKPNTPDDWRNTKESTYSLLSALNAESISLRGYRMIL